MFHGAFTCYHRSLSSVLLGAFAISAMMLFGLDARISHAAWGVLAGTVVIVGVIAPLFGGKKTTDLLFNTVHSLEELATKEALREKPAALPQDAEQERAALVEQIETPGRSVERLSAGVDLRRGRQGARSTLRVLLTS